MTIVCLDFVAVLELCQKFQRQSLKFPEGTPVRSFCRLLYSSQSTNLFFFFDLAKCSFTLAGKILGGVGGQSCAGEEGPAGVKVTLTTLEGGNPIASVLTTPGGSYKFENLLTGIFLLDLPFTFFIFLRKLSL